MEGFNYQINESTGDTMDHLGFINRSDFIANDVDRVLFDAQDSLLNSIEPISGCQDSSFLNPINDILSDINEFSKNFCCDQVGTLSTNASTVPTMGPLKCSWSLQETETPAGSSNTDIEVNNSLININAGNDNSDLLPDSTVGFPTNECGAFLTNEYSSTLNQWFQTLEHQQMSFMTAPLSSQATQEYSEAFLSTIGSLPASTTITPITMEEHQLPRQPFSPGQQEVTIETRFFPDRNGTTNSSKNAHFSTNTQESANISPIFNHFVEENLPTRKNTEQVDFKCSSSYMQPTSFCPMQGSNASSHFKAATSGNSNNLVPSATQLQFQRKTTASSSRRHPSVGYQKNRLHWTAVFPRKHFIQPPEMIIMHPLRTRKLLATRRLPINSNCNDSFNLSEYFDTSSISIPMIKERMRRDSNNGNRRKQKFHIIPGSENFIFEVQKNEQRDFDGCDKITSIVGENLHTDMDPYPENELPELDEIFRRKKKITSTCSSTGSKKVYPVTQPLVTVPPKKQLQNLTQQSFVQETSTSFEEKISISIGIRKGRSRLSIEKNDLVYSTDTDSCGSDYEKGISTQNNKSLKCQTCKKLFKTTRSLAIHTKRCTIVRFDSLSSKNSNKSNNHNSSSITSFKMLPKLSRIISLDNSTTVMHLSGDENLEEEVTMKIMESSESANTARPLTRSQTRRSSGQAAQVSATVKRVK